MSVRENIDNFMDMLDIQQYKIYSCYNQNRNNVEIINEYLARTQLPKLTVNRFKSKNYNKTVQDLIEFKGELARRIDKLVSYYNSYMIDLRNSDVDGCYTVYSNLKRYIKTRQYHYNLNTKVDVEVKKSIKKIIDESMNIMTIYQEQGKDLSEEQYKKEVYYRFFGLLLIFKDVQEIIHRNCNLMRWEKIGHDMSTNFVEYNYSSYKEFMEQSNVLEMDNV